MKLKLSAASLALVWAAGVALFAGGDQSAPVSGNGTTWSGIYTEEQAKAGAEVYAKYCAECHQESLAGDGVAPALQGPDFIANWNTLSVGDLFERIRVSMPPDDPNSVAPQAKADIVAHILKVGGFPAGQTPLPADTAKLKAIKIEATKPPND